MEALIVVLAAAAAFVAGGVWYTALARPWVRASGVPTDAQGRPAGASPMPFLLTLLALLVAAGMIRHIFEMAGIHTLGKGVLSGAGIGAGIVAPWVLINNSYAQRPLLLTLIDGGYAVLACTILGTVIGAF